MLCVVVTLASTGRAEGADERPDVPPAEPPATEGAQAGLEEDPGAAVETAPKKEDSWLPSRKGQQFRFGGELEFEYVDSQANDHPDNSPASRFQIDKFNLKVEVDVAENIVLEGLFNFNAAGAKFSEGYAIFSGLPLDSSLKVGLDDRFFYMKPNRKTEAFSLIDTAFARDDELALTWSGKYESFYWNLSLSNGLALGESRPSEDKSYPLLHDNRQTGDANDNKEAGLGLGLKHKFEEDHSLDLLVFGYTANLSEDDVGVLQGIAGYGTSEDDTNDMYGATLEYKLRGLTLGAKYIQAHDGDLDRDGWFVQASYKIGLSGWEGAFIEPVVRHGSLDVDIPKDPTDSLTWHREMTTVALLVGVAKNTMLKVEYYFNGEDTGAGDVDNDEFVMQLEMKF